MKKTLQNYFELEAKNTSIKRELLAGATTFITMVYIIFVNPTMMAETGMDYGEFCRNMLGSRSRLLRNGCSR